MLLFVVLSLNSTTSICRGMWTCWTTSRTNKSYSKRSLRLNMSRCFRFVVGFRFDTDLVYKLLWFVVQHAVQQIRNKSKWVECRLKVSHDSGLIEFGQQTCSNAGQCVGSSSWNHYSETRRMIVTCTDNSQLTLQMTYKLVRRKRTRRFSDVNETKIWRPKLSLRTKYRAQERQFQTRTLPLLNWCAEVESFGSLAMQ